mmetsp:Transcript_34076/g.113746  ORF Transcript_34076/g.113746 Transcript_34076/m.113746 type:complete len:361 (-) Transcript_34076:77-1159(-)
MTSTSNMNSCGSRRAVSPSHFGIDTTGTAAWPVRMTNAPETAVDPLWLWADRLLFPSVPSGWGQRRRRQRHTAREQKLREERRERGRERPGQRPDGGREAECEARGESSGGGEAEEAEGGQQAGSVRRRLPAAGEPEQRERGAEGGLCEQGRQARRQPAAPALGQVRAGGALDSLRVEQLVGPHHGLRREGRPSEGEPSHPRRSLPAGRLVRLGREKGATLLGACQGCHRSRWRRRRCRRCRRCRRRRGRRVSLLKRGPSSPRRQSRRRPFPEPLTLAPRRPSAHSDRHRCLQLLRSPKLRRLCRRRRQLGRQCPCRDSPLRPGCLRSRDCRRRRQHRSLGHRGLRGGTRLRSSCLRRLR